MIDLSLLSDPRAPWGRHTLSEGEVRSVRLGPRDLWFTARDGEILIATVNPRPDAHPDRHDPSAPPPTPPSRAPWQRWVAPAGESTILLRPTFPDRVLVLNPEAPFHLLPRAEAKVFVRVPLWIRVELPLNEDPRSALILEEFPTAPLSDTWWGDFTEGESAYWIPTTARRAMRAELFSPHLAACTLVLTNRSREDLQVEKLALRAPQLSIFERENGFWSDTARVGYRGDEEETEVQVTGTAPDEAKGGVLITRPRTPAAKGVRAAGVGRFLPFSGIGGQE